jgi:GNAT superfamily N-acetyltransferase
MDTAVPALRLATPADRERVDALMEESAQAIFPAFYDARQTASAVRYVARADPTLLEDGTYFILEVRDELVGCGGWSKRGRTYMGSAEAAGDDRLLDPRSEAAHVRAMFVRADWTRKGLGRRILETCQTAAVRHGFRRLDLVATLPGIPLYEAFGFTPTAPVRDIVLADGVRLPCLAMTKTIDLHRPREPRVVGSAEGGNPR